jgi:hypothetical protein
MPVLVQNDVLCLQDRDTEWFEQPELGKAKCLFLTSHFISKLCQESGGYDYSKVCCTADISCIGLSCNNGAVMHNR